MERPNIMNLQSLIKNIGLNNYQKALAFNEFDKLIEYINYVEDNVEKYAEFCIECDRKEIKPLVFEDYLKLE